MAGQRFASGLALCLCLGLFGCGGGNIGRAKTAYRQGRYLEAAERLQAEEPAVIELSEKNQAEYGLYRGLSLMMLGDAQGAQEWLAFTYNVERRRPGTLPPDQRALLEQSWARVNHALQPRPSIYAPFASPVTRPPTPAP